jgi:mannose-6-phosphate isomerase-like protein (cupin superfamily)
MPAQRRFILNAEQRVYVEHDWGHEDWLWNTRYCGKKLVIKKGKESQWQYHRVRDKVLYVERGKILLTYGWDEELTNSATLTMTADMAFHIPPGMYHKFQGIDDALLLELGTHHNEKDVLTPDSELDYDANESSDENSA